MTDSLKTYELDPSIADSTSRVVDVFREAGARRVVSRPITQSDVDWATRSVRRVLRYGQRLHHPPHGIDLILHRATAKT